MIFFVLKEIIVVGSRGKLFMYMIYCSVISLYCLYFACTKLDENHSRYCNSITPLLKMFPRV